MATAVQPCDLFSGPHPPCKTKTDKSFSLRPTKESDWG
jgi:hypothetical protein